MNINFGFIVIAIAAGLCAFPASAQNSGKTLYSNHCAVCHGPDGKANTPTGSVLKAPSYQSPAVVKATDAELEAVVKNGKGHMPPFGATLSDAQIKEVIGYVRTLQKKH